MEIIHVLFNITVLALIVNTGLSLYGVFARPSLVKKIIALSIFSDTINLIVVLIGFRHAEPNPVPPILISVPPTKEDIITFMQKAVDPVPQALVLTAIVIGLAVTLYLMFLTIQIYRIYGTTDVRKIAKLKG
ncbi:sodium:proton antiporter [Ignisphaera sp. 4213-co]|uniref:Sodium:proton antiporter n=1 Tax=Ignisphaera cupida TaxID=3050454 RepID=A0ABD4Z899_9CREN|nr:sodium:proton antiporter [Ignisphaera sp. 4213-co]MDK6028510.1 sodium:proton antiporter [Ignisphaera sp. 4213-co]